MPLLPAASGWGSGSCPHLQGVLAGALGVSAPYPKGVLVLPPTAEGWKGAPLCPVAPWGAGSGPAPRRGGWARLAAPAPGSGHGASRVEAAGVRGVRGAPEPGADLVSRGQLFAVHIWQRAAAPAPARPGVTFQECWQRLAHLERVSGGSRRPLRRLARGWGWAPPARISWLLLSPRRRRSGADRRLRCHRKGQRERLAFCPRALETPGTRC